MKDPAMIYLGHQPYSNYREYLDDMLAYLDVILLNFLENVTAPDALEWKQILEVKLKENGLTLKQDRNIWKINIRERIEFIEDDGSYFPLEHVIKRLKADDFVRNILILTLKVRIDSDYAGLIHWLSAGGKKYPTLELCRKIILRDQYPEAIDSYLAVYERKDILKALYPALCQTEDFLNQELVCDERLADILMGTGRCLPEGAWLTKRTENLAPLLFLDEQKNLILSFMKAECPAILLTGEYGVGKKHLLKHVSLEKRLPFIFYDCKHALNSSALEPKETMIRQLRMVLRECILYSYAMVISGLEVLKEQEQNQFFKLSLEELYPRVKFLFLLSEESRKFGTEEVYQIELPSMNELERMEVWRHYLHGYKLEEGFDYTAIANTFMITPGQIKKAINQAHLAGGTSGIVKEGNLYRACYAQLNHKLAEKTTQVKSEFSWEDLKLDAADKEIMRDLCNCVKNKHMVLNKWNFSRVIPYGAGLTVLFSGPPGTGKTMAAQVIANELKMELYKIDLSQVIDKYVGETEKNIRLIFEQAKKSNSILFFDEADAIFNKRLEASGSNERFANIESSLLLQCIEEYSGITILATNNVNSIDSAFIRRFKYYVLFKEPDKEVRYAIWKSVLPPEAPIGADVDLRELADIFELTGAVIKNVVISAAYLAAEKKTDICMTDILKSIQREMAKNNLILTKEKMGSFGYLFSEIVHAGSERRGE